MTPAQQRFQPHQPAAGQLDDGLIEQHELLFVDGSLQSSLQHSALRPRRVDVRIEVLRTALALALGPVHGQIRPTEERVTILRPALADGDADADPDDDVLGLETDRPGERCFDARSDLLGGRGVGRAFQKDRELVAADARGRVARSDR